MTVKQELNQLLYKQQEESYSHISIEEEFAFYRNIANGNLDVLQGDLLTENIWAFFRIIRCKTANTILSF